MAITKSAKKAHRQSLKKKVYNDRRKLVLKKAVRTVVDLKSTKGSAEALRDVYKALDKAAKKGVIAKGTADRKKSRLAKRIAKLA